jgi:hypothetical protein
VLESALIFTRKEKFMNFTTESVSCPLCESVIVALDGEDMLSERGPENTLHLAICRTFQGQGPEDFVQLFSTAFWESLQEFSDNDSVIMAEYNQIQPLLLRLHDAHQRVLSHYSQDSLPTAEQLFEDEIALAKHSRKPPYGTDLGSNLHEDNVRELTECQGGWTTYRVLCASAYTSEARLAIGDRHSSSPVAVYGYMRLHTGEALPPEVHTTGTVDFSVDQVTESLSSTEALGTVHRLINEMALPANHPVGRQPQNEEGASSASQQEALARLAAQRKAIRNHNRAVYAQHSASHHATRRPIGFAVYGASTESPLLVFSGFNLDTPPAPSYRGALNVEVKAPAGLSKLRKAYKNSVNSSQATGWFSILCDTEGQRAQVELLLHEQNISKKSVAIFK